MRDDLEKFVAIARRTVRLNFLLFLNNRSSSIRGILLGSRQRTFFRRMRHVSVATAELNLSRRERHRTKKTEITPPIISFSILGIQYLALKIKLFS